MIKDLVKSGILGLRIAKGKIHFAGPEDHAIRYSPEEKEFKMMFASLNSIEMSRFRQLPHSFLPSYYWESYYRDLYLESSEGKEEPLTMWSYCSEDGIEWSSTRDMVEAYYNYLMLYPRTYILEKGDDYLVEEYKSRRRNYHYSIHMFSNSGKLNSSIASELMGKAIRFMDRIKGEKRSYLEKEPFSIYIHSATEDWSFKAWGKLKKQIPEALRDDISLITAERE